MINDKLYSQDGESFSIKKVYAGGDCLFESFLLGMQHLAGKEPLTQGLAPDGETKYMVNKDRTASIKSLRTAYVNSVKEKRNLGKYENIIDAQIDTYFDQLEKIDREFILMKAQFFSDDRGFTYRIFKSLKKLDDEDMAEDPKDLEAHIEKLIKAKKLPVEIGDFEKKLVIQYLSKKLPLPEVEQTLDAKFNAWSFFMGNNVDNLPFSFGNGNTLQFLAEYEKRRIVVINTSGGEIIDTKKTASNEKKGNHEDPPIYLIWSGNHYNLLVKDEVKGGADIFRKELGGLQDIIQHHYDKDTGALKSMIIGLYPSVVGALKGRHGGIEVGGDKKVDKIIQKISDEPNVGGGWNKYHIMAFVVVALTLGVVGKDAIMNYLNPKRELDRQYDEYFEDSPN